jgi:hypothetical protein
VKAVSFGVVIHRPSGEVRRVFNPDFEWELDGHHIGPDEFMLRLKKADYGVAGMRNAMTLAHVHEIAKKLGA